MSNLIFFERLAPIDLYTLSLHDALPISAPEQPYTFWAGVVMALLIVYSHRQNIARLRQGTENRFRTRKGRSEEHTSELQSHSDLVCRLLLEKKKNKEVTFDTLGAGGHVA